MVESNRALFCILCDFVTEQEKIKRYDKAIKEKVNATV